MAGSSPADSTTPPSFHSPSTPSMPSRVTAVAARLSAASSSGSKPGSRR